MAALTAEQIRIILSLPNPYDYNQFLSISNQLGSTVMTNGQYMSEVNTLFVAKKARPSVPAVSAYNSITNSSSNAATKKCCGGGGKQR